MAQPVNQFTIKGYGFQGLNTEMSPIGSDPSFALRADNCIIDRVGRMASREAFAPDIEVNVSKFLGPSTDVTAVSAHYTSDGYTNYVPHPVCTVLSGTYYPEDVPFSVSTWRGVEEENKRELDPEKPYEYDLGYEKSGKVAKCSYPDLANKPGLERSVYVHFKKDLFLFSRGNSFLKYNGNGGWEDVAYTPPQNVDGSNIVDKIDGDIAISAYGRLWVCGVNGDYQRIYYSSLLREDEWYDGQPIPDDPDGYYNDGGYINVSEYWPVDFDQIVNIHAHNGFLLVFGRRSILIYANANKGDPAGQDGIFLQDAISNVGLVDRDAICNTGTDVMFCDDAGLRSLGRVIQEKSSPTAEPSMNIKREFMSMIQAEAESSALVRGVKMSYFPSKAMVVCLFRSAGIAYAFSTERPSSTGGARVTRWTDCYWTSMYFADDDGIGRPYLGGTDNKGILQYKGYRSFNDEAYTLDFESMSFVMSNTNVQTVIAKSIIYFVMSQAIPADAKAKWGFGSDLAYSYDFRIQTKGTTEWGVAEFGEDEFTGGVPGIWKNKINTTGAGEFMRVGLEIDIKSSSFAIQEIAVNTAIGRIAA